MRSRAPAELDEGTHDLDVHQHGRRFGCELYSGRRRDVRALRDRLAGLSDRSA
jgi:hypothetical protein